MRFAFESHDAAGRWFRSYGNENWEFKENGLMIARHASINDLAITETERLFHWPQGRRLTTTHDEALQDGWVRIVSFLTRKWERELEIPAHQGTLGV